MPPRFFPTARHAVAKTNARICTLAIDAEEDFDWTAPVFGTSYSTACMRHIRDLQEILAAWRLVPTYLLTYPVLQDADIVRLLERQFARGECRLGLQLHAWVTPPFDGEGGAGNSFAGNLSLAREEQKLVHLKHLFQERFGTAPLVYRAGRYGLGRQSAALLETHGFTVDTSLAPRTTMVEEGGPDYRDYDYDLFWFGEHRRILELPLCRSVVGWGGALAQRLYRRFSAPAPSRMRIPSVLAATRFAERITFSPEGNDAKAMRRLARGLLARGRDVLALSFHSSSLAAGRNPYVRTRADLHCFYDRLSATLAYLADDLGFRFTPAEEIPALMEPG